MRKLIPVTVIAACALLFAASTASAQKPGAHFVGTPTCAQVGNTLTCSGSIAGVGNEPVTVIIDVVSYCVNRGNNTPPGHVSGVEENIQPRNGRINFSVPINAGCPDRMTAHFLSPATVTVYDQEGNLVFTGTIPF